MNQDIMRSLGFGQEVDNFNSGKCATCADEITCFRDSLSAKEYRISGMCQKCQDSIFGEPEESKKSYTYFGDQKNYIQTCLTEGFLVFNVTSPLLQTYDIDEDNSNLSFNEGAFITISRSNGNHVYYAAPYSNECSDIWAHKACVQFMQGSDPRRELHTLRRRLYNDPFAELMCEVNTPETFRKLQEFEAQGLGHLVTMEMLNNDLPR